MPRTVLLTIGRMPKAHTVAQALRAAGCRVLVADPFACHLCRTSRDVHRSFRVAAPARDPERFIDDLRRLVIDQAVDVVVPVSEEATFVADLRERVPSTVHLLSEPQTRILRLHDKLLFAQDAKEYGLGAPESVALESEAARELAQKRDVVIKPRHASGGAGVTFHQAGENLPPAGQPAQVVQERVFGEEFSTASLLHQGRVLGTVIYKGLIFSGSVAVAFERVPELAAISDWVEAFAAATGYSGFVGFDFIQKKAGTVLAIECNPRLTSGVHFFDRVWLAGAILNPSEAGAAAYLPAQRQQLFFQCLAEMYVAMAKRDFQRYREIMKVLVSTRDVIGSWHDPLPLALLTFSSWPILHRSIFKRMTMGEAATHDIVWRGDG